MNRRAKRGRIAGARLKAVGVAASDGALNVTLDPDGQRALQVFVTAPLAEDQLPSTPATFTIGAALATDGDLALYACDTAAGDVGRQFIADLSTYTGGVDVAAATHPVGSAEEGGSWTLDAATGALPTSSPFTAAALASFQGVLSGVPTIGTLNGTSTIAVQGGSGITLLAATPTGITDSDGDGRLTSATVTISAPVASIAASVCATSVYFPVPTMSRLSKPCPAMTSGSFMAPRA